MTAAASDSIGLDIGGTTLKAVRVGADGTVRERVTVPAGRALERGALIDLVARTVTELRGKQPLTRIGIAVAGIVHRDGSMRPEASNLPQLAGVPLAPLFEPRLGAPCAVVNDAHAAMYGEAWLGQARGLSDVLLVTLGTGIGGALMLDGRVRHGAHGRAGEFCSWRLPDGRLFEDVAAPVPFERRTGRSLGAALDDGSVEKEVSEVLEALGQSLAAVHMLLDLEAIVIGGGGAMIGGRLRSAVEAAARRHCPPVLWDDLRVVTSALGPYAGAIGAVAPDLREPRPWN